MNEKVWFKQLKGNLTLKCRFYFKLKVRNNSQLEKVDIAGPVLAKINFVFRLYHFLSLFFGNTTLNLQFYNTTCVICIT